MVCCRAVPTKLFACVALLLFAVCACLPAAAGGLGVELIPAEQGPGGQPLYQWDPSQSWPGRLQSDSRLDQPAQLWRAGIPLLEVFAAIEEQTGVRLGFWPEGDENPRVRVNLYLNPDDPPALRDLMAQLAWVTDCAFAFAEAAPDQTGPTYYLLATSIGRGVPRDVHTVEQAARDRSEEIARRSQARNEQEVRENLRELRRGIELSRDEVIARYKGTNDYLLLTLLYPPYRAAAEYVCNVADPDQPTIFSSRKWADLSEEERALLQAAVLQFESEDWPGKTDVEVDVTYSQPARMPCAYIEMTASAKIAEDPEGNSTRLLIGPPYFLAPTRDFALGELERSPFEYMVALGEDIPEDKEEREAYRRRWKESIARERHEEKLKAALTGGGLSPAAQDLLSSLTLTLDQSRPYTLWEIQQAVAACSGLNVISDCFWQPRRPLSEADSALYALALSCQGMEDRANESRDPIWLAEWEWGDAGSFLHFRSTDRGLWRASLLPPGSLAELDEWLSPYLPELTEPDLPPPDISVRCPVDLPQLFRLAESLDDLQLAYGGRLIYEDPSDPLNACRQALRQAFLDVDGEGMTAVRWGARSLNFFRLLASLTPGQWDLLHGQGLNCSQLNADQLARLRGSTYPWGDQEMEQPSRLALEAEGPMPQAPSGSNRDSLPPMIWKRVAPGHYQRVGGSREGPLPPHSFQVRLKHVAGEMRSVLPEGEKMEGSITSWSYDYQVEANVPGPLRTENH
jgi:hypothetical protein